MVRRERSTAATTTTEIGADERHVGRLDRDVGAAAHRDADVRTCERRRVVDPVADHGDRASSRWSASILARLVLGEDFGEHAFDTGLGGDRLGGSAWHRP
jgi:hypothetical protein